MRSGGFTLIELVLAVVVTAIIGATLALFIARPMQGYVDAGRRAALVDRADTALRRMSRDIRRALPNSVRVSGDGLALELYQSVDGARYRGAPGTNPAGGDTHTDADDWLDFTVADDAFNVLGGFDTLAPGDDLGGLRAVVYSNNPVSLYADAAADASPGLITPSTTTLSLAADGDEDQLRLSAPFRFRLPSPRRRVFLVDTPVIFLCDLAGGTLTRHAGYAPQANLVKPLPGAGARLADRVTGCAFSYSPGTPQRAGLITLALVLQDAGEPVRLLHQMHVDNTP